ncbi:MAG: hypothetical protein MJ107_08765 [Lachnospiraceae bacterium]|nr:hypothetical protein [Lachnospiraceae bacterium]
MLNYYFPDFVSNGVLICFLSDLMNYRPEWFYEDAKISAAYGSFGSCIWNGGRTFLARNDSREMRKLIEEYNKRGISVRYTFTNPLIEEKHLGDTFSNLCLEISNNGMNEAIVNTPVLEQYIREKYPNFRLISSTTKCISTIEGLKEELKKDYYLVVADSVWNNTDELFALEPDERSRVELIIDHTCEDNCPRRRAHYLDTGKCMLEFRNSEFVCMNINFKFAELQKRKNFISADAIYTKYKDAGFKHFKMDGRCFSTENLVESVVYYLVKPEHQDRLRKIIYKDVYKKEI